MKLFLTKPYSFIILIAFFLSHCTSQQKQNLEDGFSYITNTIPTIETDIRYFGLHNFTGRPVVGYEAPVAILSTKATLALKEVQKELNLKGLGLKVFDGYRPQHAVTSFEVWAKDINDTIAKHEFYPDIDKKDLFILNYIASKSGHTRGSTVDLTIINLQTKQELDMGSPFDLFGTISHHKSTEITTQQKENRELLRNMMLKNGFKDYAEEWWHYTLVDEPFPDTYFDFVVK